MKNDPNTVIGFHEELSPSEILQLNSTRGYYIGGRLIDIPRFKRTYDRNGPALRPLTPDEITEFLRTA